MTPLVRVGNVLVKDEGQRSTLGAFKIVGVAHAIDRLHIPPDTRLVCASAGNHGRAVARVGRERGFPVRVYMSNTASHVAQERIRSEGAEVVLVEGSYDDAVERTKTDGGFIVSDTAWPGYEEVPRLIMEGYSRILDEAETQWTSRPDVVFVQAGVGSLAAAVVSWFSDRYRSYLVCVRAKRPTIMSGLDCAVLSSLAVPILERCDAIMEVDDELAREAVRRLAAAGISAGPSGAAGYAGFLAWPNRDFESKTVFVINTEAALPAG
jgi:diaminopropionate ammonia-lyase